jgi:DNA polymerase-1
MYNFIDDNERTLESINELEYGKSYALDTESQGLDPFTTKLLLIQVADQKGNVNIYDARKIDKDVMKTYLNHLFNIADRILLHNAKHDWKFIIHNYGIFPPKGKTYDTQLSEGVLYNGLKAENGKPHSFSSLATLSHKYCGIEMEKETRNKFIGYEADTFPTDMLEYAAKDVIYLFDIASSQQYYLEKNEMMDVANLEGSLTVPIASMELAGVKLNTNAWLDLYRENIKSQEAQLESLQKLIEKLIPDGSAVWVDPKTGKEKIYNFSTEKFNPRSYQQTLAVLRSRGFKDLESSNSDLLEKLDDEIAKAIISYRAIGKLTSSYGVNIIDLIHPVTGRIHGQFNQVLPASGRLSSEDPNLQNIPIRETTAYRMCFIAPDNRVQVNADYSNIEMRLAGEFSGDEAIIKAYVEGVDLHQLSAAAMYNVPFEQVTKEQRFSGKTFNFSVLYGASAYKVSTSLQIPIAQAETMVANWRAGFPKLAKWLDDTTRFLKENGYVKTALGRRRYFEMPSPGSVGYFKTLSRYIREGGNHPIQGTSADMTKTAIVNIFYKLAEKGLLEYNTYLIRTVHDEISVECPEEIGEYVKDIMVEEMINAGKLFISKVPVKVDAKVGKTWDH